MTQRNYGQFCPLACTLDVIGERWTFLLVRELMFGPRRFTDLNRGLPGIGKNLLSKRLKDLETTGVIRQRTLPPPTPAVVYELTEDGEQLRDILVELGRWGMRFVSRASLKNDYLGVVAMLNALNLLFNSDNATEVDLLIELYLDGEVYHVRVGDARLEITPGPTSAPDLTLEADAKTFMRLVTGNVSVQQAVDSSKLQIVKGNQRTLGKFVTLFRSPMPG